MRAYLILLAMLMVVIAAGCGEKEKEEVSETPSAESAAEPVMTVIEKKDPAPKTASVLTELKNAVYDGIEEHGSITLKDGYWEGEPYVEDSASRPRVQFMRDFFRVGDLDRDGVDEAAVLLAAHAGGTGENIYLAVMGRRDGKLENLDTVLIGDRVQIRKAAILEGRLFMDILRPGEGDAMSNPGELDVLAWTLQDGKLNPMGVTSKPLRLSLEAIEGNQWVLAWWDLDEKASAEPEIFFEYKEGRLAGKSGCNSFFTSPKPGQVPGEITLGPTGGTMMMCSDDVMEAERRFLTRLEGVKKYGYMATMLALSYDLNGKHGVMLFERRDADPAE